MGEFVLRMGKGGFSPTSIFHTKPSHIFPKIFQLKSDIWNRRENENLRLYAILCNDSLLFNSLHTNSVITLFDEF